MRRYTTCNNIHNGKMKIMINKSANMSRYRSCTAVSKDKMRIRSIVSRSTRPRCSEGHTHTHTHSDSWSFSSVLKRAHDHRCGFTTRVCVCVCARLAQVSTCTTNFTLRTFRRVAQRESLSRICSRESK